MASHKGWDRAVVATSVVKQGRSLNLARAKGAFGVVDMESVPTKDGLKVISSFAGLAQDRKLQLRLGKAPISVNRSQSDKAWSSETFAIADVKALRVDAPKTSDFDTDEFIIGYNGFDDDSALTFQNGDNEELDLELSGEAMGVLGYENAKVNLKLYFEAPNTGSFTNQEIVENAVERLKRKQLIGGVPITKYLDIKPVNSSNPASVSGTDSAFFNLVLEDDGDYTALALVQSQYPDAKVVRSNRDDDNSTYTIIAVPQETVTAGSFVVGQEYTITTVGDTDFQAIGASADEVGIRFVATGVGTGTGTATEVRLADYSKFKASKIKGCDDCPAGYSELSDGFVYAITLEDAGADETDAVEGLAGAVADSAVKVSQNDGVGVYTVVTDDAVTDAELDAFVTANPTAVVELASEDVAELCSPDNLVTTAWVEGETCTAIGDTYTITLADNDCGENFLSEINAAYEDLTITVSSQNACQTRYTTTVLTDIVCEECDAEFRDLFISEAPEPYQLVEWEKAAKTYSDSALMGIKIKGKQAILSGEEQFRDDMFFMATSTRIKVAGGYPTTVSESFNAGLNGRFAVKVLSIAEEPENWGGNLREFEDISKRYWEGVSRHEGHNYAKWVLGEETNLKGTSPYVDYILTVQITSHSQSFSELKNETFYYHVFVEPGKHQEVEDVLNALAAKAGVKPVQAYGKTSA